MTTTTMNFYRSAAQEYAADKDTPDPRLFAFLKRCRAAGKILELGTGGGVEAAAILGSGFDLDATDGSSELAAIASQRLGQPVQTMQREITQISGSGIAQENSRKMRFRVTSLHCRFGVRFRRQSRD